MIDFRLIFMQSRLGSWIIQDVFFIPIYLSCKYSSLDNINSLTIFFVTSRRDKNAIPAKAVVDT